jgi:glycosyltransferase involved in cell wall biosynthesis
MINKNPVVSVIMPAHNRAPVIGRAINSVLGQTFGDFELIVVDDGSTDNTQEVVRSFADGRLVFLRHERNRGATAARNTGIKASRANYVTFLDSDDEFAPTKLEEQMAALRERTGSGDRIIVTGLQFVNDEDTTSTKNNAPGLVLRPCPSGDIFEVFFAKRNEIFNVTSMIVNREYLDTVGLFDEKLPASQFWDLGVRLAAKYEFDVIARPLYIVHQDAGERVWNKENHLRALAYLLDKYQREYSARPRAYANAKLRMGVLQLGRGLQREARRSILEALRLDPWSPKAYIHLLSSLLPPKVSRDIATKGIKTIIGFK